jgi:hypothetical protein
MQIDGHFYFFYATLNKVLARFFVNKRYVIRISVIKIDVSRVYC